MISAPEGYIDLHSAIDRYVKAVLGGEKPDSYVKVRLKKADARPVGVRAGKTVKRLENPAGREQHSTAAEWLRDELAAEWLMAVVETTMGRRTLPALFWKTGPWKDTLHTGHVAPVYDAHGLPGMIGQPVLIKRGAFEARLSTITDKPAGKPKQGRPPGSGAYDDSEAIAEAKRLLKSGKAKTENQAAKMAAHLAPGSAMPESKQRRLRRRLHELDTN
jgi:hypothetical protein